MTLKEAAYFNLPGTVKSKEKLQPMQDYDIDRVTLRNSGLSNEQID